MATVVSLLASERGGPVISSAVLFYPVTAADFDTASYRQFAAGHFLTRESMMWFWDHYLPHVEARRQAQASPLHATEEQLRAHPPTFVMTCECDVLRDEGEAYARRLTAAGVRVTCARYLGSDSRLHDAGPARQHARCSRLDCGGERPSSPKPSPDPLLATRYNPQL